MKNLLFLFLLTLQSSVAFSANTPKAATPQSPLEISAQVSLKSYMGLVEEYLSGVLRNEKLIALTSEAKSKNGKP